MARVNPALLAFFLCGRMKEQRQRLSPLRGDSQAGLPVLLNTKVARRSRLRKVRREAIAYFYELKATSAACEAARMYRRGYRRNLPHFHPPETAIFLTWRLFGSIPRERMAELEAAKRISACEEFRVVEKILDAAESGATWLRDPHVARVVCEAIELGAAALGRYALHEYVVMPNHVHLFITPLVEVPVITRSLKGVTANAANKILGTTGKRFWQEESFDRWARDGEHFEGIRGYIAGNPVKAGLV
jgi:putative transposase